MQIRNVFIFLMAINAGTAAADARFSTVTPAPTGNPGLVYAQVQLENVSESDMRRMLFYADRATRALQALVEGAAERDIGEQAKLNKRFREAISRLAGAGERAGLSMDQVADFFTQTVFDSFGQAFMQKVGEFAGGLDFRTLFRNVSTVPTPPSHELESGEGLMNALNEASEGLDLSVQLGQTTQGAGRNNGQGTGQTVAPPQPFPNANAVERDIVSRVQVVDGRWELVVQRGDSLSQIASAIYGDALSYTLIHNANSAVIANPNVIEVGTRLVLPQR